ncbi:MAG: hypothetical protein HOP02_05655 [Methylococcaceae bacterium]|nr:hypothetical protein [Methylococcaceae bacterium]
MLLKTLLITLTMTASIAVLADVKLTEADLLGAWQIDSESINADGSNAKDLSSVWTFRADGTMEGFSTDTNKHARIAELRATLKYEIIDGKINKQFSPGRSKYETCTAIEKNGPKMVLECNHIYFSMTKK